jgi:hypothetical protein
MIGRGWDDAPTVGAVLLGVATFFWGAADVRVEWITRGIRGVGLNPVTHMVHEDARMPSSSRSSMPWT